MYGGILIRFVEGEFRYIQIDVCQPSFAWTLFPQHIARFASVIFTWVIASFLYRYGGFHGVRWLWQSWAWSWNHGRHAIRFDPFLGTVDERKTPGGARKVRAHPGHPWRSGCPWKMGLHWGINCGGCEGEGASKPLMLWWSRPETVAEEWDWAIEGGCGRCFETPADSQRHEYNWRDESGIGVALVECLWCHACTRAHWKDQRGCQHFWTGCPDGPSHCSKEFPPECPKSMQWGTHVEYVWPVHSRLRLQWRFRKWHGADAIFGLSMASCAHDVDAGWRFQQSDARFWMAGNTHDVDASWRFQQSDARVRMASCAHDVDAGWRFQQSNARVRMASCAHDVDAGWRFQQSDARVRMASYAHDVLAGGLWADGEAEHEGWIETEASQRTAAFSWWSGRDSELEGICFGGRRNLAGSRFVWEEQLVEDEVSHTCRFGKGFESFWSDLDRRPTRGHSSFLHFFWTSRGFVRDALERAKRFRAHFGDGCQRARNAAWSLLAYGVTSWFLFATVLHSSNLQQVNLQWICTQCTPSQPMPPSCAKVAICSRAREVRQGFGTKIWAGSSLDCDTNVRQCHTLHCVNQFQNFLIPNLDCPAKACNAGIRMNIIYIIHQFIIYNHLYYI